MLKANLRGQPQHKLFKFFPEAMQKFRDEPKRQDAYIRARRVFSRHSDHAALVVELGREGG